MTTVLGRQCLVNLRMHRATDTDDIGIDDALIIISVRKVSKRSYSCAQHASVGNAGRSAGKSERPRVASVIV